MTYEPLHHKYRPQTFADLVGQSAIATTLSNALISERIAPAYLFTGPRGTGKTSSARILAKSLNCLSSDHPTPIPCGKCSVCQAIANGSALDVIEIDAASNTGVDNIREIIERSQFAPVQCRYKVYVIDECLTGDSLVFTETGLIPINHPEILGKRVLSYNESSGEWEYKKVLRWLNRGVKATLTIQTRNRTINCTGNHLIRTEKAWIQAKNLKIGDQILSPVNVAAGNSSLSMEGMDITDVSFQGIKTTAIVTEQESMTWPLFCNRLNPSSPFVSVAVGKNWKFPCFSNKKAEGSKVLNPIGKDILTNKDTVYGKSEPKNYCSIENLCPQTASDLYTGLYSEMELSITPTKTVDGREYAGIMAVNNKNGLNTKPVVFQSYKFSQIVANNGYGELSIYARSVCHPSLGEVFQMVRPQGERKFVSLNWLENITPEGLAWWYMDDGSLSITPHGSRFIQLHTEGYSPAENQLIADWLTQRGYATKSLSYTRHSTGKIYHYLKMGASATARWIADLQPYAIPSMAYKFRGSDRDSRR
jgi:DNA polymerase-3 subunit gamma/tau